MKPPTDTEENLRPLQTQATELRKYCLNEARRHHKYAGYMDVHDTTTELLSTTKRILAYLSTGE